MPARDRIAERSFVLTIATFILLTPPIVTIFNAPVLILGVPLLHIYCFAVWLAAIVAGARLARRLGRQPGEHPEEGRDADGGAQDR